MIHNIFKKITLERSVKYITRGLEPISRHANLTLSSNVDQDTFGKVTKHNKHYSQDGKSLEDSPFPAGDSKITTFFNPNHWVINLSLSLSWESMLSATKRPLTRYSAFCSEAYSWNLHLHLHAFIHFHNIEMTTLSNVCE